METRFIPILFVSIFIGCFASGNASCEKEEIKKMSTDTLNQKDIADAIEESNGNYAWLLRESDMSITPEESPYFHNNSILKVESIGASHPTLFFVSKKSDGTYKLLTGDPEAFNEIIRSENLSLSQDQAVDLSNNYIELTQDRMQPLYTLNTFNDIPYLGELDAEQLQKKHQEQNKYGKLIQPPVTTKQGGSFEIKRYILDGKELQRWTMQVQPDGTITVSKEKLDADVGVYYWM